MKIKYEIRCGGGLNKLIGFVELKSCPFCGEQRELEFLNTHTPICWIECIRCTASIKGHYFSTKNGSYAPMHFKKAIRSAKTAWNQRRGK